MTDLTRGFMLMGYGLAGVFTTLILFYICAKVFMAIAKRREKKANVIELKDGQ